MSSALSPSWSVCWVPWRLSQPRRKRPAQPAAPRLRPSWCTGLGIVARRMASVNSLVREIAQRVANDSPALADTVARTIGVPVGVITALIGAPFLLWLLHRARAGYAL